MTSKLQMHIMGLCAALSFAAFGQSEAVANPQNSAVVSQAAQAEITRPIIAEPTKIIFLGDSLTAGFGLPRAQAWPEQVQQRLSEAGYNTKIINAGVSGDNTRNGLARYDRSVGAVDADVLVIALGANDFLQGVSPTITRRNLRAIIERAQRDGLQVVLAGISSPQLARLGHIGEAYASIYPDLAREYNLALSPSIIEGVVGDPKLVQRDGFHPNRAGVRIMADRFSAYLGSVLAK